MHWVHALLVGLTVASDYTVWRILSAATRDFRSPAVVATAPDYTLDWKGLV